MSRTLIFDVNETLSDLTPVAELLASIGVPTGAATTWLAATLRDGFALSLTTGARAFPEVAEQAMGTILSAQTELSGSVHDGVERVMSVFSDLPVHDDVTEGVRALAAAGHRLVTLSNGSADYAQDLLERAHLADVFEAFLSVDEVGVWKPHPLTYQHALTSMSADAGDAGLVATHPWDLHGAHALGLTTVHLNRNGTPWPTVFNEPDIQVRSLTELPTVLRTSDGRPGRGSSHET